MIDFLSDVCLEYIEAIDTHLSDGTGWFVFANYEQGRKTMPLFASLDAFYPGLLVRDFHIYTYICVSSSSQSIFFFISDWMN